MSEETLRRTPLYQVHQELKARMVPYAGWTMPVLYTGILEESRTVRAGVGLFDISHMGRIYVTGSGALGLLQRVTSNDVDALKPGQAQYSFITNPQGGIIDDVIVYRTGNEEFWVVLNASNTAKDMEWIQRHAGADVLFNDWTERTAMIAVQGPEAPDMVAELIDSDVIGLPRFSIARGRNANGVIALCRTGYTGEDGFELIINASNAAEIWRKLQSAGGVPCGLGARDALRIEAGYPLYGHEIDETITPVEAGLMWAVSLEKGEFIGRDSILDMKQKGPARRLVGITLQERIVPRQGYTLWVDDTAVGTVTSGIFSPTKGYSLGMAFVENPYHKAGTEVQVEIRNQRFPATVVPKKDLLKG